MPNQAVPIVSSGRAATILCKRWLDRNDHTPDAVVVEGPLAGGHLGFKPEEIEDPTRALGLLIPEVVAAVKTFEDRAGKPIPVVAAGGIYSRADILKFERLGSLGGQMATRFVTTRGCDASRRPSNRLHRGSPGGHLHHQRAPWACPGAPSRTPSSRRWRRRRPPSPVPTTIITCDYNTAPYCIALALVNAQRGRSAGASRSRAQTPTAPKRSSR